MVQFPAIIGALALAGFGWFMSRNRGTPPNEGAIMAAMLQSETADRLKIQNVPRPTDIPRMAATIKGMVIPLLTAFPGAVITSGYRSQAVNALIPGTAINSQHTIGEAVDIRPPPGMNSAQFMKAVYNTGIDYDKMIAEAKSRGGHLHISYSPARNRRVLLMAPSAGGYQTVFPTSFPDIVP